MVILNRSVAEVRKYLTVAEAAYSHAQSAGWLGGDPAGQRGGLGLIVLDTSSPVKVSGPGFSNDHGPGL